MEAPKNPKPYNTKSLLAEIAKYDPELAEEIAEGSEPAEERIARELVFARAIKDQRIRDLDFETFLSVGEMWMKLFEWVLSYMARLNSIFLQNYTVQMSALADMFIPPSPPPMDHKAILANELVNMARDMRESIKNMLSQPLIGSKVPIESVNSKNDVPPMPTSDYLALKDFVVETGKRKSNKRSKGNKDKN